MTSRTFERSKMSGNRSRRFLVVCITWPVALVVVAVGMHRCDTMGNTKTACVRSS